MGKDGYSRTGLFGTTTHYDSKGHKIGESREGIFGGTNHYDAKGNKTGYSEPSIFGGQNHYDNSGNKTGYSAPSIFGGMDHYDAHGNKTGYNSGTIFGGSSYYGDNTDNVALRHDSTYWQHVQQQFWDDNDASTGTFSGSSAPNTYYQAAESSGGSAFQNVSPPNYDMRSVMVKRQKDLYAGKSRVQDFPIKKMIREKIVWERANNCDDLVLRALSLLFPFDIVEYFYTLHGDKKLFRTKDGLPLFQRELTRQTYNQAMLTMAKDVSEIYITKIRKEEEEKQKQERIRQAEAKRIREKEEAERQEKLQRFQKGMIIFGVSAVIILLLILGGYILTQEVLVPWANMRTLETAMEHVANNEMNEAEEEFNKLGSYSQWSVKLQDAYHAEYNEQYEDENYDYLLRLADTSLPRDIEKLCIIYAKKAETAEKNKQYKKAAESYSKAYDYGVAQYQYLEAEKRCYYQYGMKLYKEKKYLKAIEAYKAAASYKESPTYIKKCYYQRGMNFFKKEKYEDAMEAFTNAKDYKQADSYAKLCDALDHKQAGYYWMAYDRLETLPKSFKPSQKYLNQKWYVLSSELDGTKWVGTYHLDDGYSYYYYFEFEGARVAIERVYSYFDTWDDLYQDAEYAYPTFELDETPMKKGNMLLYEDYNRFVQVKSYDGITLKVRYYEQEYSDDEPTFKNTVTLTRLW